jgi:hypothetical protein
MMMRSPCCCRLSNHQNHRLCTLSVVVVLHRLCTLSSTAASCGGGGGGATTTTTIRCGNHGGDNAGSKSDRNTLVGPFVIMDADDAAAWCRAQRMTRCSRVIS